MNAGLLIDMPHLEESGADSIGLFRTELQFMLAPRFPRLNAQEALYRSGARRGRRSPGDVPHARHRRRQDAALHEAARRGESGARLARDPHRPRPARRCCARSCARCCAPPPGATARHVPDGVDGRRVRRGARLFDREIAFAKRCGHGRRATIKLGVMVEVPSLLWQLDEIAAAADFLSVGSNDLMQYLFAADRDNKRVAGPLRPAVGRLSARAEGDRRRRRAQRQAGDAVRRDGRPAARRDGADRARLPQFLDGGDGDRSDQGDGAVARRQRGAMRGRRDATRRPGEPRASRCARSRSRRCAVARSTSASAPLAAFPLEFLIRHDRRRQSRSHPAPLRGNRRPAQRGLERRRTMPRCRANSPSSSRSSRRSAPGAPRRRSAPTSTRCSPNPSSTPRCARWPKPTAPGRGEIETTGASDPRRAAAQGRRRRRQRHSRGSSRHRRRRGGPVRRRPVPDVCEIRRSARAGRSRCCRRARERPAATRRSSPRSSAAAPSRG